MVRIEIQVTKEEAEKIVEIAKKERRSRKAQCEFYIRKMIVEDDNKNNEKK